MPSEDGSHPESPFAPPSVMSPALPPPVPAEPSDAGDSKRSRAGVVGLIAGGVVLLVGAVVAVALVLPPAPSPDAQAGPGSPQSTGSSPDQSAYETGPDGLALPGKLTRDDRLPASALPTHEGLWASAQVGWALGIYDLRISEAVDGERIEQPHRVVLYLATDEGELYQALELSGGAHLELVHWRPGETTAIVAVWEEGSWEIKDPEPPVYRELNLLTGEFAEPGLGPLAAPFLLYLGRISSSEELWARSDGWVYDFDVSTPQTLVVRSSTGEVREIAELAVTRPASAFLVSPGAGKVAIPGHQQHTKVIEISTGAVSYVDMELDTANSCSDIGWYDESTLVRECSDWDPTTGHKEGELQRHSVLTGEQLDVILSYETDNGRDLEFGNQARRVGDLLIHSMAAPEVGYECRFSPWSVGDGSYQLTALATEHDGFFTSYHLLTGVGSRLYAVSDATCPAGEALRELVSLDTASDTKTVLFPALVLDRGEKSENPGLTTFVIGVQ